MVPRQDGGLLGSFEEAIALQRVVSRRDLTTAIALGQSFLGTSAVWLAGTKEQRSRTAEVLLSGRLAALALTEEEHGSDVLATSTTATREAGGWRLDGRKWLINNATRGSLLTLFAKSAPEGGLHGCSLFLLDKDAVDPASLAPLPKIRTHGIRGADISGLLLRGALLPAGALLGAEGGGAELLLQCLQLTRTACAAFSLGAADTALRLALDFACTRRLYGGTVLELPHARRTLTNAFLDLLLCDAVATAGARAIEGAPEQLSLWSSIIKYFVPVTCERVIREVAVVLGARHYLRDHASGAFQKLLRDAAVVSLFDGSTAVNLDGVATQLPRLAPSRAAAPAEREATLERIFSLSAALPPFEPARLALMNAGRDDVTQGVPEAVAALRAGAGTATPTTRAVLLPLAELLQRRLDELRAEVATLAGRKRSPELFAAAERFCGLFAGASALHLWLRSPAALDPFFAEGDWLAACLERLLPSGPVRGSETHLSAAADRMLQLHSGERAFAHTASALGRGAGE